MKRECTKKCRIIMCWKLNPVVWTGKNNIMYQRRSKVFWPTNLEVIQDNIFCKWKAKAVLCRVLLTSVFESLDLHLTPKFVIYIYYIIGLFLLHLSKKLWVMSKDTESSSWITCAGLQKEILKNKFPFKSGMKKAFSLCFWTRAVRGF